jgi:hypothetical protein
LINPATALPFFKVNVPFPSPSNPSTSLLVRVFSDGLATTETIVSVVVLNIRDFERVRVAGDPSSIWGGTFSLPNSSEVDGLGGVIFTFLAGVYVIVVVGGLGWVMVVLEFDCVLVFVVGEWEGDENTSSCRFVGLIESGGMEVFLRCVDDTRGCFWRVSLDGRDLRGSGAEERVLGWIEDKALRGGAVRVFEGVLLDSEERVAVWMVGESV